MDVESSRSPRAVEKDGGNKEEEKHGSDEKDDTDMPSSLNLRELSKVILPPLGVSSFTDGSKFKGNKWIVSPMSSRYRYTLPLIILTLSFNIFIYFNSKSKTS